MKEWLLSCVFLLATRSKIKILAGFASGSLLLRHLEERKSVSLHDGDIERKVMHRSSSRVDGSSQGCASHDSNTSGIGYFFPRGDKRPEKVLEEEAMVCFGLWFGKWSVTVGRHNGRNAAQLIALHPHSASLERRPLILS